MNKKATGFISTVSALLLLPLSVPAASAYSSEEVCSAMTQVTYRSINPTTGATLLSTSSPEIAAAGSHGFTEDGEVEFKAAQQAGEGLVPVYRLYREANFTWLPDTPGAGEYENAQSKYEYDSQQIDFYASPDPLDCTIPVHRLLKGDFHRFVADDAERQRLVGDGWTDEGAKFWVAAPAPASAPAPVPAPPPAPAPAPAPLPADQVAWSSVARAGDDINEVLAKPELTGKILKLPAGVFEVSNFLNGSEAIVVPSRVKGIVGEGRNTILRVRANSSSYGWTVPQQGSGQTNQLYVLRMTDGNNQILSNLWVQGTEQGHLYNGIMVGRSGPGTKVENVLITGIPGNNGAPPGETFGLNWWRGSDSVTRNVEIDGYRWTGNSFASRVRGPKVGASPIGYNNHDNARLYDVYTHDSDYGMPTFWLSNNATTWNLQSVRNAIGINHEESFGIVHHQPVMYGSKTRRHVNFMSNRSDGTLTIIGATNDEWISPSQSGPVGKGKKMLVLTPTNYTGPNTNRIFTAPRVVFDDGRTSHPYLWAH